MNKKLLWVLVALVGLVIIAVVINSRQVSTQQLGEPQPYVSDTEYQPVVE